MENINIYLLRTQLNNHLKERNLSRLQFCTKHNISYDKIQTLFNPKYKGVHISVLFLFKITSILGTNIYDYIQN